MSKNITKFDNIVSEFTTNTTINDNELIKSGILFYESDKNQAHKDSKGKTHYITKEVIEQIVENTNKLLDEVDIPIVKEHNKVIDDQVGLISDKLEARQVTIEDVINRPKLKKLIGKTAIFCNAAKILDKSLIEKAKSGIPLRVSIGLDVPNKVIRELSVVTIPALNMATLFSKYEEEDAKPHSNFGALTLADQIAARYNAEIDKEQAKELFCDLLEVIENIKNADESILQGQDPNDLVLSVLDEFENELALLLGIGEQTQDQNMQGQYNNDIVLDAFSMNEMENLILAEFLGNINLNLGGRKKKQGSLLGNVAKTVAGGAALAAGARYGGASLLKNSATARKVVGAGLAKGYMAGQSLAKSQNATVRGIGNAIQKGTVGAGNKAMGLARQGARGTLRRDVNAIRNIFRKKPKPQRLLTGSRPRSVGMLPGSR